MQEKIPGKRVSYVVRNKIYYNGISIIIGRPNGMNWDSLALAIAEKAFSWEGVAWTSRVRKSAQVGTSPAIDFIRL